MNSTGEDRVGTRLPEGVPPLRPRWLPHLPDRGRWGNRRNRLLCCVAALGIGTSLWAYWLTYTDLRDRAASKVEIAEACAGIVDVDAVMRLRGGVMRASSASDRDLQLHSTPSACRIYRVPGPGRSDDLFTLTVRTSDDDQPVNVVGDDIGLEPFKQRGFGDDDGGDDRDNDVTRSAEHAEPHPLGDGALGHYSDNSVTVHAVCTPGARSSVTVTARADYDDVSDEDRRILAALARDSASRAAAKQSCKAQPAPDAVQLPAPERELGAPKSAKASCAWYGKYLNTVKRDRLPDRMLETPLGPKSSTETCLLAVSPDGVRSIAGDLNGPERRFADSALTHSPWWMRTATYFGPQAESVGSNRFGDITFLKPGTAGGDEAAGVWWASSVCAGRPAIHALTVSYTYDNVAHAQMQGLFRAYVEDITKRRGCTGVKLPRGADFAPR